MSVTQQMMFDGESGVKSPVASVVITTYNWAAALRLTLHSLLNQSFHPFDIVVADDGSADGTADVVQEILGPSGFSWCHVRHDHQGVRQSRIKNLAVRYARAPYLIFVDQDTVPHPEFVRDHLAVAAEGVFLQGKRVLLDRDQTERAISRGSFKIPHPWSRGLENRKNAVRCSFLGAFFSRPKAFQASLRGCNLSLSRADFLKVDGFDEAFDLSWGREDSDICYRLFHAGVKVRNLWFSAIQYHLFHGKTEGWDRERLDSELQRNLAQERVKAVRGFSTLSEEGGILSRSGDDPKGFGP